jgi:hypothetical protein
VNGCDRLVQRIDDWNRHRYDHVHPITTGMGKTTANVTPPPLVQLDSLPSGTWSLTCQECFATSGDIPNGVTARLEHYEGCPGASVVNSRLECDNRVIDG